MQGFATDAFRPYAVNERGVVAGYTVQDTTVEAALLDPTDDLTRLGTLGGRNSVAYALNDAGQVVGTAQTSAGTYRAFEWERTMRDLGRLGGSQSEAFAINPQGTAAGAVVQQNRIRAWVADRVVSGDEGRAYAINGLGQAAGSALVNGQIVARVWRADEVVDLGTFGGWAEAYALNDAGWVVGTSAPEASSGANATVSGKRASSGRIRQWQRDPAFGLRRGQLQPRSKRSGQAATQHHRAFLWIDGALRDLNDFLPDEAGWTLLEARHVNNRGQIVGYGLLNGAERAFLLTPTDQSAPTAEDDVLAVAAGASHRLSVLDNDADDDGDPLRIVSITPPQLGAARVSPDGRSIHYRAAPHVQGTDVFAYVVGDGTGMTSRGAVRLDVAVSVDPTSDPRLEPSAPNPARSQVRIRYLLPTAQHVRLTVYDVLGRRQAVLVDQFQQPGAKDVRLDVSRWPGGTYFYRLTVEGTVQTRKLTVVR
jgi:probable HAF family extracellular repeat protein